MIAVPSLGELRRQFGYKPPQPISAEERISLDGLHVLGWIAHEVMGS
jgi:hypothetical protein